MGTGTYNYGDIVSTSRAQTSGVTVLTPPAAPGEPYTVALPINGVPVPFTHLGTPGESVADVVDALLVLLKNPEQQAFYRLAPIAPGSLIIQGPQAFAFAPAVTANMSTQVVETAIVGPANQRNLRVIRTRNIWTKDPQTGQPVAIQTILVRGYQQGNAYDLYDTDIKTLVARREDIP